MNHTLQSSFKEISEKIVAENKTLQEWAEIESDDMFQNSIYVGGFDATEMEFCFSVYIHDKEYWFQLPYAEIIRARNGESVIVELQEADY